MLPKFIMAIKNKKFTSLQWQIYTVLWTCQSFLKWITSLCYMHLQTSWTLSDNQSWKEIWKLLSFRNKCESEFKSRLHMGENINKINFWEINKNGKMYTKKKIFHQYFPTNRIPSTVWQVSFALLNFQIQIPAIKTIIKCTVLKCKWKPNSV